MKKRIKPNILEARFTHIGDSYFELNSRRIDVRKGMYEFSIGYCFITANDVLELSSRYAGYRLMVRM